jgi:Zn finger protein HypA/HybF involved in hydrogenase expression
MGLITKKVEIRLGGTNIQWYKDKGYLGTKNDKIMVKIEDLQNKSTTEVDVQCDNCNKVLKVVWANYTKCVHDNDKYYCNICSNKLFGVSKSNKTKLSKSISFKQWCVQNDQQILLSRWDYELNKCDPDEINYASNGINRQGYWFKCLNNQKHKSELKNIQSFTCGQQNDLDCKQCNSFYQWCIDNNYKDILERWDYELNNCIPDEITYRSCGYNKKGYWFKCLINKHESELKSIDRFVGGQKGSIECNQCKMILFTHPNLVKYFVNIEDVKKYSIGSNQKVLLKCPDCGYEKLKIINDFGTDGFGCPKCNDGISYGEKFMFNLLEQLDISFQFQKIFDWSNKRYDFYLIDYKTIIEIQGLQHYQQSPQTGFMSLRCEQENDEIKENLALENNIKYYISLDCRESNLEWIKNSVINSILFKIFDFNHNNIDWVKCHEYAVSSKVKEVCDLWCSGINNVKLISERVKLYRTTIVKYLKIGLELGWCDYNHEKELIKNRKKGGLKNSKKVICINTMEVFNSIMGGSEYYNIPASNITMCCSNKRKSAGKHPITNEPLQWMHYDDYLTMQQNNQT